MSEALDELFLFGEEKMEKAIASLKREFGSIRSGRANPMILDKVLVDYYGVPTQLRQMSQVTVQDGTTLVISPYDKSILKDIEKGTLISLFIGSEGGFSDSECSFAVQNGADAAIKPTNILRAETAGIFALGAIENSLYS